MLYLGWVEDEAVTGDVDGPWEELFWLRPGLVLVRSDHTRSEVYHALKHELAEGSALLVAPLAGDPKFKGMADGALTWVRRHGG